MSKINWMAAYRRLFEMINSPEVYYSGPKFLETIQPADYSIPSYNQLIEDRTKKGQSTSRKDFFYDVLMSLNEKNRVVAYQMLINQLGTYFPEQTANLQVELNLTGSSQSSAPVATPKVPVDAWNADKLRDFLERMDNSITQKNYNRTLTLAYSCLEGVFKAYIQAHIPNDNTLEELNPMAKTVRDHIKKRLDKENKPYPDTVITLFTSVTNALSNARNRFSESHFAGDSEEWIADHVRDYVNTVARLVLKFM